MKSLLKNATTPSTILPPLYSYESLSDYSDGVLGSRDDECASDYVTQLQWNDGNIVDNVQIALHGLLGTKIPLPDGEPYNQFGGDNPLISMELRHQEVRKRRKERDHAHALALREEQRQYEIRQRAHNMIKREQEKKKAQEKREEIEIKRHMIAIRKQVKEQRERERYGTEREKYKN